MQWLDHAKSLVLDGSSYIPHTDCSERKVLWVYHNRDGYGCFCNKCGYKRFKSKGIIQLKDLFREELDVETRTYDVQLPDDIIYDVEDFPIEAKIWLYKADIRNNSIRNHKIGYSKSLGRVILPMYNDIGRIITWQGRALFEGQQPKYLNQESLDKNKHLFNPQLNDPVNHKYDDLCIVTEDILSSIRVNQVVMSVSSLGTSLSDAQTLKLTKYKYVGIWYDPDNGGIDGAKKAIKKLNLYTTAFNIQSEEDPKNLPLDKIKEIISERFDFIKANAN